jgi:hypothetical protein
MRCPNCGNEVGPEEAFCGQCGTSTMPPARPTEMVNTSSPRSGLLSCYNTNMPSPSYPNNAATSPSSAGPLPANQQQAWPTSPQQQSEFYQQSTEAMSAPSPANGQVYSAGYPVPGFDQPAPYGTGQYNPQIQPFQTGGYTGTGYQQPPALPSGQGYGYPAAPPRFTPPPPKQRSNGILVFASVCLVVVLLILIGFGALYLLRGHSTSNTQASATATPTSAPSPTAVPSPSPSPTATATPTPTPSPTPTVVPTPTPDPGFTFCTTCATNGFQVEYPQTWQPGQTNDGSGVMYTNPSAQDVYAAFKTPGATTQNANELVTSDLQNNYHVSPTTLSTTTIGGETWAYGIASYSAPPSNTQEQVEVYATVHQGKAYIIELQAHQDNPNGPPDKNGFSTINSQYFEKMLGSFQFVQSPSQ